MEKQNISFKIEKKVFAKMHQESGLFITLKKTETCCSMLVEPKVNIIPVESIENLENTHEVKVYRNFKRIVAVDTEIFDIYPKQNCIDISMKGFPIRKPKVNIPAEIVSKEACK